MAYVYRHIRQDTNTPFYIGIGSDAKFKRAYSKYKRKRYWVSVTNKTDYKVEIILDELDWNIACKKEKEFISLYKSFGISLVNLTDGGEGMYNPNSVVRKKISEAKLGIKNPQYGIKWSDERKEYFKIKMQGEGNPNFGKKIPDTQKMIIASAQKGRVKSDEEKEKIYSKTRKKVINTETNHIYTSINEVARVFKKSPSHMTRLIKKNKFNLKFLADASI